jgi:eukaryotic-like serine/threonine-protein kinase
MPSGKTPTACQVDRWPPQEYIPGKDPTKAPKPNTPEELLRLIYPIAEGIADVHAHKRVHRDIKRQNMKYDAEGCLKIFDFGGS